MPVISHPARHNRAAGASGFWLLWLGSDLMAVIIISPVLASASPAAKISKPAAQAQKKKKSRLQYCRLKCCLQTEQTSAY
jgi:hypothetical protein